MHNKRRGGGMNGGQHRHHNNRGRRYGNNQGGGMGGGGDSGANVARTRRNALQNKEKYQMMARDALSMGDRVLAESYLQHSDHYHRILLELPPEEVRQQPHYQQRDFNQPQGGEGMPQQNPQGAPSQPQSQAPQGLPSFITQPGGSEFPEE